jgi:[protein-PII] uridylyltransferase
VLAQAPIDLARQAGLCETVHSRQDVRVEVEVQAEAARIEIAARDRVGLLARATRVIFEAECSIQHASATTWDDGIALASYRVVAPRVPDSAKLSTLLAELLRTPLVAAPVPEVDLAFDDASSPWHTRCTVTAPDRPGLLHALTASFASAGVSVHSARITTNGDRAVDYFELSDGRGAKLDERTKARILEITRDGAVTRRRRFGRGGRYMTRVRTKTKLERVAWTS